MFRFPYYCPLGGPPDHEANEATQLVLDMTTYETKEDDDMGRRRSKKRKRKGGGVDRVVIPRIDKPGSEILNMPAGDRPLGWFYMFEHDTHPSIVCFQCREVGSLNGHKVTDMGEVKPSIVCPNDEGKDKCDWHVFGILVGWDGADKALPEEDIRRIAQGVYYPSIDKVKQLAHQALEWRRDAIENEPDEFRELMIYAIIGLHLGKAIMKECEVDAATVKRWALGFERPFPVKDVRDKVVALINKRQEQLKD